MKDAASSQARLVFLCWLIVALTFLADLWTPLGVAAGIPFIAVMLAASRLVENRYIFLFAIVCTMLSVIGFFFSSSTAMPGYALANRILTIFAIWVTAALVLQLRRQIDQRESTASSLETSERLLRSTLDALSAHIAILDKRGTIIDVNLSWRHFADENQLAWTDYGMGRNYLDITEAAAASDAEAAAAAAFIRNLIAGQIETFRLQYPCHSPDRQRWFIMLGSTFQASDGVRIVLAHENITEQLSTKTSLQKSEWELKQAQRIAHLGSWEMDIATGKSRWSDEFFRICGYEPQAFEPTDEIGFQLTHPDDRERAAEVLGQTLKNGVPYQIEKRVVRPDGEVRDVLAQGELIRDDNDQPVTLVGTFLDITERKQVEKELAGRMQLSIFNVDIGIALTQSDTLANMLQRCTEAMTQHLDAALARIWTLDETGVTLQLQASAGLYTHLDGEHGRVPVGQYKIGQIARRRQPLLTNDVIHDPNIHDKAWAGREGLIAFAGYPLIVEAELVGVMAMFAHHQLTDLTLEALAFAASGIAIGVKRSSAEAHMKRHVREMEALYQTSLDINARLDSSTLVKDIVQRATDLVDASGGALFEMQPDGNTLKMMVDHHYQGNLLGLNIRLGEGVAGRVAQTGKPFMVSDYQNWEGRLDPFTDRSVGRVLGLPLEQGDQIKGVLIVFDTDQTEVFDQETIRLLHLFASQAMVALENTRLFEAEQAAHRRAETMREVTLALTSQINLTSVLDEILRQAQRLVAYNTANIMLLKGDGLHIASWQGYDAAGSEHIISNLEQPLNSLPLDQQVIRSRQPLVIHDTQQEPDWVELADMAWIRASMSIPICRDELVLGVLRLDGSRPGEFSIEDAKNLQPLASVAAIAIENTRLLETERTSRERLQALSQRFVELQEAERHHLARELHDEIGQSLTAIKINLQTVQRLADMTGFRSHLETSMEITEQVLQQVRNLSLDLRPSMLDDLGLIATLRWYLNRQAQWGGFKIKLVANPPQNQISPDLEIGCFRVVQEALTNILRHAQARHVQVELRQDSTQLHLTIQDDGLGFDIAAARQRAARGLSLGLAGMEERVRLLGGQIKISAAPNQGTKISASFPLPSAKQTIREILDEA